MNNEKNGLECYFCGRKATTLSLDEWVPYHYDEHGREVGQPTCPRCAHRHLRVGPDHEWEVRTTEPTCPYCGSKGPHEDNGGPGAHLTYLCGVCREQWDAIPL